MNQNNVFNNSKEVFTIPFLLVILIWFVYWIEIKFGFNFNKFGVYPRSISGLKGVFLTHFIHSDTKHLFNNSVPLFVLTSSLLYFYRDVAFKLLLFGTLLSGLGTWIVGRESYHIGASGVVYLLFSFVFFSGVFKSHYRLVALSLITIFLYGSMIWFIFPIKEGMSWEGHLSGFLVGLFFAFIYRKVGLVKEKYVFTHTEFDDMFDDDGNYIEPSEDIEDSEEQDSYDNINYRYIYRENNTKED
jgi:membrane associated rhomboid family serine protease